MQVFWRFVPPHNLSDSKARDAVECSKLEDMNYRIM